jgi:glutathione S-transferase
MADSGPAPSVPGLITFPASSDCENARWVLDHYGIAYREEPHAPPFFLPVLWINRGRAVPMYIDPDVRLSGLTAIVQHFEALAAPDRRLVAPGRQDEVQRLWTDYDLYMDQATVTWAYTVLLPKWRVMIDPLSMGTPAFERFTVRYLYPLPALFLWKALKLGRPRAAEALVVLRCYFAAVSERLADGRPYLTGDRLTLADIAFAVAGAPLVLPLSYGGYPGQQGPRPALEQASTRRVSVHRPRDARHPRRAVRAAPLPRGALSGSGLAQTRRLSRQPCIPSETGHIFENDGVQEPPQRNPACP